MQRSGTSAWVGRQALTQVPLNSCPSVSLQRWTHSTQAARARHCSSCRCNSACGSARHTCTAPLKPHRSISSSGYNLRPPAKSRQGVAQRILGVLTARLGIQNGPRSSLCDCVECQRRAFLFSTTRDTATCLCVGGGLNAALHLAEGRHGPRQRLSTSSTFLAPQRGFYSDPPIIGGLRRKAGTLLTSVDRDNLLCDSVAGRLAPVVSLGQPSPRTLVVGALV